MMNGARHQLFARPALADDKDHTASAAGSLDTIVNPPHGEARAQQPVEISPDILLEAVTGGRFDP
ncbi:MAG TPA: hypothetical protein VGI29_02245 [Candidatus Binataceae bacterium]